MVKADGRPSTKRFAEQALGKIFELGITPHPMNYAVWYGYFSGQPDIRDAIDAIAKTGRVFDDNCGAELYQTYFSFDDEGSVVRETSQRVEAALGQVVSMLHEAGDDTSRYGDALAGISGDLSSDNSIDGVRKIIGRLNEHTQAMIEQNQRFEQEIKESNKEITQLRKNLEDTRLEAMTDPLTGLYNRKFFNTAFFQAAREASVAGTPLSVLMLDIDHFKKFNDTYGHNLGDLVLKQVARCLASCVKGRDVTARFGGEEFVILLPDTAIKHAMIVAEQVRKTVAGKKIVVRSTGKSLGKITLSIGVAQLRSSEDVTMLLERADAAMYLAKNSGRNRIAAEEEIDDQIAAIA